jgi:hypothetical protein
MINMLLKSNKISTKHIIEVVILMFATKMLLFMRIALTFMFFYL